MSAIVGIRLAASLGLLIALAVIEELADGLFPIFIALILIALPVLQWATVYFFAIRLDEHPEIEALRIRVQDAVSLALASSVAALLGLGVVFRALNLIPSLDRTVFLVGLAYALLMAGAPAANWLITWKPWRAE